MTDMLAALITGSLLFVVAAVKTDSRIRSHAYLIGFSVLVSLALAEFLAMRHLVYSDPFCFTLSARRWNTRYWRPVNSAGFRDREWSNIKAGPLITFVGDSFVAGSGIEDISDRFAEKTAEILGPSWQSIVLAKRGWGPIAERKALAGFSYRSKVVVLSYFINDIEDAYPDCGRSVSFDIEDPPSATVAFFEWNSYLVSFLYWRWWRSNHLDWAADYWRNIKEARVDPTCMELQWNQLGA